MTDTTTKPNQVRTYPSTDSLVDTELTAILYRNVPMNTMFHGFASIVLCIFLWDLTEHAMLIAWWLSLTLISAGRLLLLRYYSNFQSSKSLRFWRNSYFVGATLAGLFWGLAGVFLSPHEDIAYEIFTGFLIAGMAMGAVPVLSSVRSVYQGFAIAADTPYIIHMLEHGGDIQVSVAIVHIAFLLLMLLVSRRVHSLMKTSLKLRYSNNDLIEQLKEEVESHKVTENNLLEKEQRLNALGDATFEGIILHRNGMVIEANRGIAEMTGYEPDELIGNQARDLIAEADQNKVIQYMQSPANTPLEAEVCHKEGNIIPVELRAGFVPYRSEQVAFVVVRDITYYKELLKTQEFARQKAEEADQAKTEFLAAVSHELRTPLNAVMGFTQLLQGTSLTEEQEEYLSMTYQSGDQLLSLINDLLDLSRIESGRFDLDIISFNLLDELNNIINLLSLKIAESGNLLNVNFSDDLPEIIEMDPLRLRQVLLNILGNAIKFTENGAIEFSVFQENGFLVCIIKDSGRGIPDEKLEFIFGKFNQIDSSVSRQHGGAGLGLAISKRLVEGMQGKISVTSKLKEGTTFRVDLPLSTGSNVTETVEAKKPEQAATSQLNILLVEDDKTNQMIAIAMLKKFGHIVTVAENGQQAVELCQQENNFQLIFMDIQMPVMDGMTAATRLRELGVDIPIVAMTANAMTGDREAYLKAGMSDYISKPIYTESLLAVLANFS